MQSFDSRHIAFINSVSWTFAKTMPDVQDYEWYKPVYDTGALEQYVRSISSEKMRSAPGERYAYSNMAFECLGDVIAKVSGMSFAEYVKKYILNPSGMKESTFLKPDYLPENWAAPHTRIVTAKLGDEYPYNRMHGPSSTLHSNILEMCNWAMININPSPVMNIKSAALDIILGFEPYTAPSPASIPVCKELEKNGLDSAVALWDSLKTNHPEEYDFHPQHFVGLFIAMDMDRVEDAEILARLCVTIFPDQVINNIKGAIENYYSNNPDNTAAPAILKIIMEK